MCSVRPSSALMAQTTAGQVLAFSNRKPVTTLNSTRHPTSCSLITWMKRSGCYHAICRAAAFDRGVREIAMFRVLREVIVNRC